MSSKKGITLIALILTITVIVIISSMLIYSGINNTKIEKIQKVKTDIKALQDSSTVYYMQNSTLPVELENGLIKVLDTNEVITELGSERNQEDNDIYYILDINLLDNITLNTNDPEGKYIINDQSHTVYYIEGVNLDSVTYHSATESSSVPTIKITPNTSRAKVGGSISVTITLSGPSEFTTNNIQYYISDSKTSQEGGSWNTIASGGTVTINSSTATTKYIHVKAITDVLGKSTGNKVSDKYVFSNTLPVVTFTPNGSLDLKKTHSTKVLVTSPDGGIIDPNNLKYQWTKSTTEPAENTFTEKFSNGGTISKTVTDTPSDWYLWILAKDTAGNTTIARSEKFYTGPIVPIVTITADKPAGVPTNAATINYTFTWNVPVINFNRESITVTNGIPSTFTTVDSKTYKLAVTTGATQSSNLDVSVAAGACKDVENTNNMASSTYSMLVDRVAPKQGVVENFFATGTGDVGDYQEYIVPMTGTYTLGAWGASGSNGPTDANRGTTTGGKGAYVYGEFDLNANDKLIMLVGQEGGLTGTVNTGATDTAAGRRRWGNFYYKSK